jgi:glyceraldehyde 3-phosphate dehydrogenase
MTTAVAINGLGRIGRALLRILHGRPELGLAVVAINDRESASTLARLLSRDSIHGPFPGEVGTDGDALVVDSHRIPVFAAPHPREVPWEHAAPRLVVEATGAFLGRSAAGHLRGSVERVVLTANAPEADVTLCLGVNEGAFDPAYHRLISNSSCTTNCLTPLLLVLERRFGVRRALMTTVHSVTVNQRLLDLPHPDPRRGRAAMLNIIPTATTAPRAVGTLIPELAGRVEGLAVRVPTPAAAMLDLAVELARDATADAVRAAFCEAAAGTLAGILAVTTEDLVSSDFIGSPFSATVDLPLVAVVDHRLCRVVAWYDNEWGYSHRLAELLARLGTATGAAGGNETPGGEA